MLASSPLDTPRVQVVVLGHSATEGQASTAKLPATDRLASGVRQATDRVLEFTRSQSDVWSIEPNWRDDASESTWTGADADTTLLYLAGALFSDEHRVGIQVAGQDSGREPRVVDLGKRLRELSKRRSHVVLLVDALFEPTLKATTFPEFAAWQWTHAIERQLAVLPEDSISIVLQISQLPPTDEAALNRVVLLADQFAAAFGDSADTNADRQISSQELVAFFASHAPTERGFQARRVFFRRSGQAVSQVALLPVRPSVGVPVSSVEANGAMPGLTVAKEVAEAETYLQGNALTIKPRQHAGLSGVVLSAPTAAASLFFQQHGIVTGGVETAQACFEELRTFATSRQAESQAVAWSRNAAEKYSQWDLAHWASELIQAELPWETRRLLLQATLDREMVLADSSLRERHDTVFKQATWQWLDAKRSVQSPVRQQMPQHVYRQATEAAETFAGVLADQRWRTVAAMTISQVIADREQVLAAPVEGTQPTDDVAYQLLLATEQLVHQHATVAERDATADSDQASASNVTPTRKNDLLEKVVSLRRRLDGLLREAKQEEGVHRKTSSTVPVEIATDVRHATRIRLARSLASLRLQQALSGTHATQLRELASLAEDAQRRLRNSDITAPATRQAVLRYLQRARRVESMHENLPGLAPQTLSELAVVAGSVKSIAADNLLCSQDADTVETVRLATRAARCQAWAEKLRFEIGDIQPERGLWEARLEGRLSETDHVQLVIQPAEQRVRGPQRWEVEFDADCLEILLPEESAAVVTLRPVGQAEYRFLATQRMASVERMPNESEGLSDLRGPMQLTVRRRRGHWQNTSINVRRITQEGVERLGVPVEMPQRSLVELFLAAPDSTPAVFATVDGHTDRIRPAVTWLQAPNRTAKRSLWLRTVGESPRSLQVRLLAVNGSVLLPSCPVSGERADIWLAKAGMPPVIAQSAAQRFDHQTPTQVLLPPEKRTPDQPVAPVQRIVCEVSDASRQSVQFISIAPEVTRPAALVTPHVRSDADQRLVEIELRRNTQAAGTIKEATIDAVCQVFDPQSGKVLATGECVLPDDSPKTVSLSTARCHASEYGLRLLINGWPSSFVYRLPMQRSGEAWQPATESPSVSILAADRPWIVPRGRHFVEADVWLDMTDHRYRYGHDTLRVGFDINGDRRLIGEPFVTARRPVDVGFQWAGVDPRGNLLLTSRVRPLSVHLPTDALVEGRFAVLAEWEQGTLRTWSSPAPVIVDSTPPRIQHVRYLSPLPAELGKPVLATIIVDDGGLSEAAEVEAAWSMRGELAFAPESKRVEAQRHADGSWAVAIPTAGLLAGEQVLLVRATDHAGNVGELKAVPLTLWTATALAKRSREATTAVQGMLAYVRLPVAGMQVSLQPVATEPAGETPPPATSLQDHNLSKIAPVTSDTSGRFVFPAVQAGDYQLQIKGLYRGMNRSQTVRISVRPPQPTTLPTIRID